MGRTPRFVIATPICDGHDVAAAAITRILRNENAEAVYIGFNKTPYQIAKAASEEDATAIAISTYNGGHMTFLGEVIEQQAKQGIAHVPLFAGGGGTILEREVAPLERLGVAKVYRPPLDLTNAVRDMAALAEEAQRNAAPNGHGSAFRNLSRKLTDIEWQSASPACSNPARTQRRAEGLGHRWQRRRGQKHPHRRTHPPLPARRIPPATSPCSLPTQRWATASAWCTAIRPAYSYDRCAWAPATPRKRR